MVTLKQCAKILNGQGQDSKLNMAEITAIRNLFALFIAVEIDEFKNKNKKNEKEKRNNLHPCIDR